MTLVRNSVRYLHVITNERNSEGRNSVFVCYCVQEPVSGELWFAANISWPGANLFPVANCYARFQEIFRGERSLEVDVFLPANEFSGEPFASSRRSTGELGRTPANVRRTPPEFGGVSVLANQWRIREEFARACSSSPEFAANDNSPGILPIPGW